MKDGLIFTFSFLLCSATLFAQTDKQKHELHDSFKSFKLPEIKTQLSGKHIKYSEYDNMPLFRADPHTDYKILKFVPGPGITYNMPEFNLERKNKPEFFFNGKKHQHF